MGERALMILATIDNLNKELSEVIKISEKMKNEENCKCYDVLYLTTTRIKDKLEQLLSDIKDL